MTLQESTADLAATLEPRWASRWFATHLGAFVRRDRSAVDVARVEQLRGRWIFIVEGAHGFTSTCMEAGARADAELRRGGWELEEG